METHEAYVNIETAKLLKQAGFNWTCENGYLTHSGLFTSGHFSNNSDNGVAAPTLDVAKRWLREVKHYNLEIKILSITGGCLCWYYKVYKLEYCNGVYHEVKFLAQSEVTTDTYELASDEGIQKCLTTILDEEKEQQ